MWDLQLATDRKSDAAIIALIDADGVSLGPAVLREKSVYWWKLTLDHPNAFKVRLIVNGAELQRDAVSDSEVWFRWDIDFNAGFADIDLRGAEPRQRPFRLTIDPALNKLLRHDFRRMLRDILADSRSLASTSGLKASIARGKDPLPIAKLELILESVTRTTSLVESLNRSSRRRLGKDPVKVSIKNARRITTSQWKAGRRNWTEVPPKAKAKMPAPMRDLVELSGDSMPKYIVESRAKLHSSRREHREILGLLCEMSQSLRSAIKAQVRLSDADRDSVLVARCTRANRRLRELQLLPFFAGIEADMGPWKHSHLYTGVEPYRSLYRLHRDVRSGISSVDGDFASIPLQQTYQLYETWVALRLAAAAYALDPSLNGNTLFTDNAEQNALTFSLSAASVEFNGHVLDFKPSFGEIWKTAEGIGSSSRPLVPDIVLSLRPIGTSAVRTMVVLDSKYRVESQLNAAISSIHTYRDALLQTHPNDEDRRVITGGLVIVPQVMHETLASSEWQSAKMPEVLFRRGYQDRFRLGALTLRPGMSLDSIASALSELIAQFTAYQIAALETQPVAAGIDMEWSQKYSLEFRREIAIVTQKHQIHRAAIAVGLGVSDTDLAEWLEAV